MNVKVVKVKKKYSNGSITISGPSAVGKNTISKHLAEKYHVPFYDLDELICQSTKFNTTKEIIDTLGHAKFKEIQHQELINLLTKNFNKYFVACGGEILREGYDRNTILSNRKLINKYTYNICIIPSDDIDEIIRILYPRLDDGKRNTRTTGIAEFKKYTEVSIHQYFELADMIVYIHDANIDSIVYAIAEELTNF